MTIKKLAFRPGINREWTEYSNEGGWFDCDKIRFRMGLPEKIGGWQMATSTAFLGSCRALKNWSPLDNSDLMGIGTHLKYYVEEGGTPNDITPIRRTVTLGSDPIDVTDTSTTVTINDTSHGANEGDFVTISGATATGGVPAADINKEHQVVGTPSGNAYNIVVDTAATSTVSGGGASVQCEYQINVGLDVSIGGTGWGADGWGEGGWGEAGDTTIGENQIRIWSHDNFGEDLLICPRNGMIYYWDKSSGLSTRAVEIGTLSGANHTPTIATEIMVSDTDRHVIAFGVNRQGESTHDKMYIRWGDTESVTQWETLNTNAAGGLTLSNGSEIVTALQARNEILVWTDAALYSFRFVGGNFVFGAFLIDSKVSLIGPKAKTQVNNVVYWMGKENFYRYDGTVSPIPCFIRDYVFSDINLSESTKVYCSTNLAFNEVIWLYPSASSSEIDRYACYNYVEDLWFFGTMVRTAWIDRQNRDFPQAAASDGLLYDHENGMDDGESNPPGAISSYIEGSSVDIDDGYRFPFIRRLIPDISFRDSSAASPSVTLTIKPENFPGSTTGAGDAKTVTATSVGGADEQYTGDLHIRVRGRAIKYRIESATTGVTWRSGTPRIEVRADGRR
jgi:hypothetical protein